MNFLVAYRLPILTVVTWLIFISLIFVNILDTRLIRFSGDDVKINKHVNGSYGKYSFELRVIDTHSRIYHRSYKNYALSNDFTDLKNLDKSKSVWLLVSSDRQKGHSYNLIAISSTKPSTLRTAFEAISYVINNQTLLISIPLILTLLLCSSEYKVGFKFHSQHHKNLITTAYLAIALFICFLVFY